LKSDGRKRPLGIAALEDKVLQRAVVEVLNAVYEEDFLGPLWRFRPAAILDDPCVQPLSDESQDPFYPQYGTP